MRIAQISDNLPPNHNGGAEVSCAAVMAELKRRGHEVLGLTNTPERSAGQAPDATYVESSCFWGNRDSRRLLSNYAALKARLVEFAPDLVHVHLFEGSLHGALLVARDFPTVFTAHNYSMEMSYALRLSYFMKHPRRIFSKRFLIYAKHLLMRDQGYLEAMFRDNVHHLKKIICPSLFMQKRLQEVVDPNRLVVVYNGVEDEYADKAASDDTSRMLYVGRMDKIKGIEYIIRSAHELLSAGHSIAVTLLGSGNHERQIRAEIRRLGLEQQVIVLKAVARVDYSLYDGVLVYPSVWEENCSMTILEALSAGKIVICTAQGGNKELVTHMDNGLVVKPKDHREITERLLALRQQPELVSRLSRNARASFLERFTVQRQVDGLERLYAEVLNTGAQRRSR